MPEENGTPFEGQNIQQVELVREMKKSYIDYAMSVIVSRALPDVRDGLKPVHRRILYTMYEDGLTPDKTFRKSATTVGDVLGRYHPHGDASVYDALVRLAQDFSMRYPLVDGHGNFGSVDGDPPAAYRYTEARLSKITLELLSEIDKETVNFSPNYDNLRKEPDVLPARYPNLLVNGSTGIAVGMATNIPPHNLRETIDATICLLENDEAELDDLMAHIQGPDFPTKGIIIGKAGIRAAYATGRGRVKVRARAEIEEMGGNRFRIIVTELPYQVNKARLIESIAELHKDKRIEGISALRDESGRAGMKIVIELKREANPQVILNQLYTMTSMQTTFGIILLALVDGQPKILSLREILDEYIRHQREVIQRRTRYDLRKAEERAHLLEGLHIAVENIDEVIRIIRASYNDAKQQLIARFDLSDVQGQAIVDMRLGRLQGLEIEKIENELHELAVKIAHFKEILSDDSLVRQILKEELLVIREKYGDERRTEIDLIDDEIDIEDLIDETDCVYTLTHFGYIKRLSTDTYRAQRRGGRGVAALTTREEDFAETLFISSTHDHILFFTNEGRLYRKKGYTVPEAGRTAKGTNIINLLPMESAEKVTAMIPVRTFEEDAFLVMVTKLGTVKRMKLSDLNTSRKGGIRALSLDEGDELISVHRTDGGHSILIATHGGKAICFSETDIRPMGRSAVGVRGIRLSEGDFVVGAARVREGGAVLTVTEKGYGKRTLIEDYMRGGEDKQPQRRGGKGLNNYNITEKTGNVAGIKVVDDNDDVLIISDDGTVIRMAAKDINIYSRATQGVILMRVQEGAKVIGLARLDHEEAEEDEETVSDGEDGAPESGAPENDTPQSE
ncbi:DNA gyrase subunit A [Oscillospiraceae bacterium OttesenSCG-928-F05]|nr:DNA gyrase subunit A [Oscillospiraceae bacterium OttesenSCG-928-F05]